MTPRIRAADAPDGLLFPCDARFLGSVELLNLTTRFGDLDLSFLPSGTAGYDDLCTLCKHAVTYELDGLLVPVASLADVIRSKEAANRNKDRAALPPGGDPEGRRGRVARKASRWPRLPPAGLCKQFGRLLLLAYYGQSIASLKDSADSIPN